MLNLLYAATIALTHCATCYKSLGGLGVLKCVTRLA